MGERRLPLFATSSNRVIGSADGTHSVFDLGLSRSTQQDRSMVTAAELRAVIMGGSLGGLTAAVMLQRAGIAVDVFERSHRPLEGRGAGIVLHPASVRAVTTDITKLSARAVRTRYVDASGCITHDEPCSYRFTSYLALHRALLDEFDRARYHLGSEVVSFQGDHRRVVVQRADGPAVEADLLVCADGINSLARRVLMPAVQPAYAGYVGWRGTVVERNLSQGALEILSEAISYCIIPNSHILIYPIPGFDGSVGPDSRLINWVWYRNVTSGPELDGLMTDRAGVRQPVSLGAGAVRDDTLACLRRDAAHELPPPLAEMVARSPQPFVQVVLDIASPRLAFGRVAIMGDAAFALRPHVAAGTAKAAEDAALLARAVSASPNDISRALRRWEGPQLALGRAAMERARDAGVRSQFENSWRAGDALPFGLYENGDSRMQ